MNKNLIRKQTKAVVHLHSIKLSSNEERIIHKFCDRMQIPFDKIAFENSPAFMWILSLPKLPKNSNNMKRKARPQAHHRTKKKSVDKVKDRYPNEWVAAFYKWQMLKF